MLVLLFLEILIDDRNLLWNVLPRPLGADAVTRHLFPPSCPRHGGPFVSREHNGKGFSISAMCRETEVRVYQSVLARIHG